MDCLDSDFLIPVVIACDNDAISAAHLILKNYHPRPYLFGYRFTFAQRLLFDCKRFSMEGEFAMVEDLCRFASEIEPQGFPVLVYPDSMSDFIEKHSQKLESRYVAINATGIITQK